MKSSSTLAKAKPKNVSIFLRPNQAQAREHRKLMLHLEHQTIHDPAITRQEVLNEQEYEHHELLLKLERQYASSEIANGPRKMVLESLNIYMGDREMRQRFHPENRS